MTKRTDNRKSEITHWKMEDPTSREVSFRTSSGDNYHSLTISRFPSPQAKLAEFISAPYRERACPIGLTSVNSGLSTHLIIVPSNGIVKADSRLTLDYCDESSCGPEYVVDGYFSNGNLISVYGATESIKPYLAKLRDSTMRDDNERLNGIFGRLLQDRLAETSEAFKKIQNSIRHSDLPEHYIDAVKGIL